VCAYRNKAFNIKKLEEKVMGIIYDNSSKTFHLQAANTSYVLKVLKGGYLAHVYWGKKLRNINSDSVIRLAGRAFSPSTDTEDLSFSLDTLPQEYPAYGNSDFRTPAYQVQLENGSTITDLRYASHRIMWGKPAIQGLPSTYVLEEKEAETLEIDMIDAVTGLKVILSYTAFEHFDVVTRSVRFINDGPSKLRILRALSISVDFGSSNYDILHLSGAWARERHIEIRSLASGNQSVESRRGASSHQHNPFIALLSKNTTEDQGEVYGFNLVYSGNFLAQAEVDQYKTTRVSIGINPFDFSWLMEPGQSFQTPEAVLVYSDSGLGKMSRTYHKLYRTRLCRGLYKEKERPILVNNWEATYFDFNAEKIENIARAGSELGIELFVLDDGWFGKRNDDRSSLGDWFVNTSKLPGGLRDLAERVNKLGMKFGLWFEPEMISPDSQLYRAHPDWCLHVPDRRRTEARNQLILDLSRPEVCEYIINTVAAVLRSAPISYVKWDMNRHMTEIGSIESTSERQRETAHRYMLGLYRVMEEITTAFPEILFESCSGGGGRFDPGILYYMPQTWTSDNTDAVERLYIQYGTSVVYPASSMGAHVSAVPNHQVHRDTPLRTRGDVAISGNFGYELDLTRFTDDEKEEVKRQVAQCKELRKLIQFGEMYRLLSPFEGNESAWMFVSEDKSEAFVAYFRVLAKPNAPLSRLLLKGLDTEKDYHISGEENVFGGDELMHAGISIPYLHGDYQSITWKLNAR
jgi:alpha-galactosidase